jgi:hypothetical protein
MSTSTDPNFDQRIAAWLESGPNSAPDGVLETVLAAYPSIPRRRGWRTQWRYNPMPVIIRVTAAVFAVALLAGAAVLVLRPPSGPSSVGASPSVTTPVSPSPAPSPMSDADYHTVRNQICADASAQLNPLKLRFVGTFDVTLSETARNDWLDALDHFSIGYDAMIARLDALRPPVTLAAGHAQDMSDFRSLATLIRSVTSELRANQYAAAKADDLRANPIGDGIAAWEAEQHLTHCP